MGMTWSGTDVQNGESTPDEIQETGPDISPVENLSEATEADLTEDEVKRNREEELEKLKEDLAVKRDLRRKKLGEVSDELTSLRDKLKEETEKRLELEEQLKRYKNGSEDVRKINEEIAVEYKEHESQPHGNITAEVEALRISRYDEDEEDEIDILEEEEEDKAYKIMREANSEEKSDKKKKGTKKRVSFSLDLVKEDDEETEAKEETKEEIVEPCKTENGEEKKIGEAEKTEVISEEVDEMAMLRDSNKKLQNQVKALKDVASLSKQLLGVREAQIDELNRKVAMVELKEKDYEKKMTAMKQLRKLYEERGRAMLVEHKQQLEAERTRVAILESKLRLSEDINEDLAEKNKHLGEKVKNLDNQLDEVRSSLSETKIKLATEKESLYHASSQISLINNLVSQVISGPELDLDRLARFLEENHALISELTAKGDIDYVASALVGVAGGIVEMPKEEKSDIAENLGKVWRVLVELLSHHKKTENTVSTNNQEWDSCYKSVDTPKGPKLVISVSQTFIKLKDLILEKNSLVKEVGRLRKLNEHLECRMEEQEGRLTLVTEELHNTWDVVNKLKRQHDSLHTHERILKHELQHKRTMLNGLKKQLEICREQWTLAREKNSKTENDWLLLRAEFAMRKQKKKFFNSAESGYEDEEIQSPEYDTDDDKSLEIDESPENSVNENTIPTGNTTPSEVSNSDASEEGNGPISEILDSIFDEALKIANTTKKENVQISESSASKKVNIDENNIKENEESTKNYDEHHNIINVDYENTNPQSSVQENDQKGLYSGQCDRNSLNYNCDILRKHCLEQIPEVEENAVSDNHSNDEILEIGGNTIEIQESEKSVSLSSIIDDVDQNLQSVNEQKDQTCSSLNQIVPSASNTEEKSQQINTNNEDTISSNDTESNDKTPTKSETGRPTTDEILRRRDERLRRMEESCKSLFIKMGHTSNRSNEISSKLDLIHATYGPQQQLSLDEAFEIASASTQQNDNTTDFTEDAQQNDTSKVQHDLQLPTADTQPNLTAETEQPNLPQSDA